MEDLRLAIAGKKPCQFRMILGVQFIGDEHVSGSEKVAGYAGAAGIAGEAAIRVFGRDRGEVRSKDAGNVVRQRLCEELGYSPLPFACFCRLEARQIVQPHARMGVDDAKRRRLLLQVLNDQS